MSSVVSLDDHQKDRIISDRESTNPKGITHNHSDSFISFCSGSVRLRRILKGAIFFSAIALGCFCLLSSSSPFPFFLQQFNYPSNPQSQNETSKLAAILQNASMNDGGSKTVIMTTLNDAWAEPNSIFDLFMESFQIGNDTARLVKNLVVICMDDKAYARCLASHPHCYQLRTIGANFTNEADFMSQIYLDMMWRRIEFLGEVLQMGYNFLFTDTDIMWLRNPFQRIFEEADFQIACDYFNGDSYNLRNFPNGGFTYVRSNARTIKFYKFWYFSRKRHPRLHDQDVLNKIKFDPFINKIGLKIRFLDTAFFGGFCQPSKNLDLVCTMHANCCVGLENKINDLAILLEDWRHYHHNLSSSHPRLNPSRSPWSVPLNCSSSFQRMNQHKSGKNR